MILCIVSLGIVIYLYSVNTGDIRAALRAVEEGGSQASTAEYIRSFANARGLRLAMTIPAMLGIFVLFGYLISFVALRPARDALKAQKRFIRNIAHELRTPLSIIKTNSEIALLDPEIEQNAKKVVGSNIEELDRVSHIINNMLTLSALARPDRSNFAVVDLARVVKNVLARHEPLARSCQVCTMLLPCTESLVWGNATALDQIASNILKNAIIYTPASGTIGISVATTPEGEAELKVSDTGLGMSATDLERIFEPFYRADDSRTRGKSGSGIGLTIVSELVRLHHGSISIQSEPGKGTAVTVRLPGAPASALKSIPTLRQRLGAVSLDFSDQISGVRG